MNVSYSATSCTPCLEACNCNVDYLPSPLPSPLPSQPRVGDQVFYLKNNRSAAEFMAVLWYLVYRRFKRSLPVTVSSTIKYQRPGGKNRVLECDEGLQVN